MNKDEIIAAIEKMTVMELNELVKAIEEKFGVSAAAPVMMGVMPGAGPAADVEQTEFDVILTEAGQGKIGVIKVVKEITGLGLKESKDLVDAAPKPVKTKIPRAEAEEIKEKLTAAGAVVEIK
ncbi:MAG: 50S ribosomal protein L7/L12 [Caldisericales bacterium]|nr:50S ribosomal protein L7/L12 [Caldisericales bacterium]